MVVVKMSSVEFHSMKANVLKSEAWKNFFYSFQENSILYSLSHEVSQRATIADKSLTALQNFVDVLVKHFPGRPKTMNFLHKLDAFVRSHEDILRGEDLQVALKSYWEKGAR